MPTPPPRPRRAMAPLLVFAAIIPAACDARPEGPVAMTATSPECTVSGAKLVAPALSEAELCARFMAPVRAALKPGETISVRLSFKPLGMAEAVVSLTRPGAAPATSDHGIAVSDRGFRAEDIDQLAQQVILSMATPPQK